MRYIYFSNFSHPKKTDNSKPIYLYNLLPKKKKNRLQQKENVHDISLLQNIPSIN